MKRILKWIGIVVGVLIGLLIILAAFIYFASEARMKKLYTAPEVNITASSDPAVIERGKHLVTAVAVCFDCHGPDLGGTVYVDDPMLGKVVAPNLTKGKNGKGNELTDADIAKVLRYGLLPNGRSARVMPSEDYAHFSDEDLRSVISYIRSVPPVDSDLPETMLRPVGRALMAFGMLPIMSADKIDVSMEHVEKMTPATDAVYGGYLANIAGCTGCHGPGLSGGPIPAAPPDWPEAANLTPSGELIGWTEEMFMNTIRTGIKPSGAQLKAPMPYKTFALMTDDELKAVWAFIQSMPAKPAGTR